MTSKKSFLKSLMFPIVVNERGRARIPKAVHKKILDGFKERKFSSQCKHIEDYFTEIAIKGTHFLLEGQVDLAHYLPDPTSSRIYNGKRNTYIRFNYARFNRILLEDLSRYTNISSINDVRDVIALCAMIGLAEINGGVKCVASSEQRISSGPR